MTIKTKHDVGVGDKVWIMYNNYPAEGTIREIEVIHKLSTQETRNVYYVGTTNSSWADSVNGDNTIFTSKDDLIDSLK